MVLRRRERHCQFLKSHPFLADHHLWQLSQIFDTVFTRFRVWACKAFSVQSSNQHFRCSPFRLPKLGKPGSASPAVHCWSIEHCAAKGPLCPASVSWCISMLLFHFWLTWQEQQTQPTNPSEKVQTYLIMRTLQNKSHFSNLVALGAQTQKSGPWIANSFVCTIMATCWNRWGRHKISDLKALRFRSNWRRYKGTRHKGGCTFTSQASDVAGQCPSIHESCRWTHPLHPLQRQETALTAWKMEGLRLISDPKKRWIYSHW